MVVEEGSGDVTGGVISVIHRKLEFIVLGVGYTVTQKCLHLVHWRGNDFGSY